MEDVDILITGDIEDNDFRYEEEAVIEDGDWLFSVSLLSFS